MDPLTENFPRLTSYQFASNRPINGIDLDGLEWVLSIRSVDVSNKFKKAYTDDYIDYYRLRELTNYWNGKPFEGDHKDWHHKTFHGQEHKNVVMEL